MLSVSGLSASYGAIRAVEDLHLQVPGGSLIALLGSNGAGKSTTLRCLAGLHRPDAGEILLDGTDIAGSPTHQVVRRGVALVPEGRMIVAPLTVEENLRLSAFAKRGQLEEDLARVYELFPRLKDRRSQTSGLMSGGEQQMLAVGRALMTRPDTLLLDEPSMGLAPVIVDSMYETIVALHREGQSILLVEQNAALALPIADYAYVISRGTITAEGTPDELHASPEIHAAYLG